MKSIFDPTFRYTPSYNTDLRKTFARVRHERRRWEQQRATTSGANVTVLDVGERRGNAVPRAGGRG